MACEIVGQPLWPCAAEVDTDLPRDFHDLRVHALTGLCSRRDGARSNEGHETRDAEAVARMRQCNSARGCKCPPRARS